jgi:hypothetical protein
MMASVLNRSRRGFLRRFVATIALLAAAGCTRRPAVSPRTEALQVLPPGVARPGGKPVFVDATEAAGLHFVHNSGSFGKKYLPETMGSGVCVLDYDGDGWPDLLFVNSADWPEHHIRTTPPSLYRNNHDGTFSDTTRAAGLDREMYGMGCAAGDYDNDGHEDLYLTALGGSHLFRNLGNGRFADVTDDSRLRGGGFPTAALWFDYDNDGKLDLFVSHYVEWTEASDQFCTLDGTHKSYCTPELYKGETSRLYHNLGGGRFEDVTARSGIEDRTGKSLGVAMLDYDDDGYIDLFVANDTQPDKLYHNNGDGTFTDAAFTAGVAFSEAGKTRAGMGTDASDYDRSGRQGILVGNFSNESLALYHNDGGGLFSERSRSAGIAGPSAKYLTFGTFFFDYDLDGLPDIFAANGHVADDVNVTQAAIHYAEPALLFKGLPGGRFADESDSSGSALTVPAVARGAAFLDYDGDGDLDVVTSPSNGAARLLRNDNGNARDMLRVRVVGTKSNRDGIGARVVVTVPGRGSLLEMVRSGSSYMSQSEMVLTFGLGAPASGRSVSVEVTWPSHIRDAVSGVAPNQEITIEEGRGIVARRPLVLVHHTAASR